MEEVINVIDDTFNKSTLEDLRCYIKENSQHNKWLMCSDYCIGDNTKSNDVISFTIMPYDDYLEEIKNLIISLAPTDIKHKRTINSDFIAYLKEKRLFHINFILGSRKGLTQVDGYDQKDMIMLSLDNTIKMLNLWCGNTPGNANYYREIMKKAGLAKAELSKTSANYNLFRDVVLVSLLAGYVAYMFTKFAEAKIFGWFSDRDKMIDAYGNMANFLFGLNHHGLCEKNGIDSSQTKIVVGVPDTDEDGNVWYDEIIRLPDHIAGTLADWDIENNLSTKTKFIRMLEDCVADNPYLVILRLTIAPNDYHCARMLVSRKEREECQYCA